jgi:hypothetical protein
MIESVWKVIKEPRKISQFIRYQIIAPLLEPFRRIDRYVGVTFFDGTQRFTNHIKGEYRKTRLQTAANEDLSNQENTLAEELDIIGFVEFESEIDEEIISTISTKFDQAIESGEHTFSGPSDTEKDYRIGIDPEQGYNLRQNMPEVEDVLNDDIIQTLEAYYGTNIQPTRVRMWRNYHVPSDIDSEVFSDYWHVDENETDTVKLFVYLTDVTEDHGPFHVISLEDSKRIQKQSSQLKGEHRHVPNTIVESEAEEVFKFTGPRGSTAISRTTTNLHRAGHPNENERRDILQIYFAPAEKRLRDDWLEHQNLQP